MGAGVLSMVPGMVYSASISLVLRLPVPHWRGFRSAQPRIPLARGMCYNASQILLTHGSCYTVIPQ